MDALINAAVRAELGWPVARLEAALATLEAHGDRLNAAQVRRLNGPPCPARARRP